MLKIGKTIKIVRRNEFNKKVIDKYKVVKAYPHIVLCRGDNGFLRSFSKGDLIILDLIKQPEYIESKRLERDVDRYGALIKAL